MGGVAGGMIFPGYGGGGVLGASGNGGGGGIRGAGGLRGTGMVSAFDGAYSLRAGQSPLQRPQQAASSVSDAGRTSQGTVGVNLQGGSSGGQSFSPQQGRQIAGGGVHEGGLVQQQGVSDEPAVAVCVSALEFGSVCR